MARSIPPGLLAGLACLLPAFGAGPTGAPLPASFVRGCEQFPPEVTASRTGAGPAVKRPRNAPVGLHLLGSPPARRYVVVGCVEVRARSRNSNLDNLLGHAARKARELGADALVDIVPGESSTASGRLVVTANLARWERAGAAAAKPR